MGDFMAARSHFPKMPFITPIPVHSAAAGRGSSDEHVWTLLTRKENRKCQRRPVACRNIVVAHPNLPTLCPFGAVGEPSLTHLFDPARHFANQVH
jgi:hypothetical protein